MKVIWKFPLAMQGTQLVMMPKAAAILSVQLQNDLPCIWAMVDGDAEKEPRSIHIYGTGHALTDRKVQFIGTIQMGSLVFHVFEDKDF
jgi:hypothetical protein